MKSLTPYVGSALVKILPGDSELWRKSWPLIKPHWPASVVVIVLGLGVALTEALGVTLLLPLINGLISEDPNPTVELPALSNFIDLIIRLAGGSTVVLAWILGSVVIARASLSLLVSFLIYRLQWGFVHDLRVGIYHRLLFVSFESFTHQKPSDLMYAIEGNVVRGSSLVNTAFRLVNISMSLTILMVAIVSVNALMSLITIVTGALISLIVYGAVRRTRQIADAVVEGETEVARIFGEGLGVMRLVRTYSQEKYELNRFRERSLLTARAWARKYLYKDLPGISSEIIAVIGLVFLLSIGLLLSRDADASIAPLLAILTALLLRLMPLLRSLNTQRALLASEGPDLLKAFDWLEIEERSPLLNGSKKFTGLQRTIQLENVSFTYETRAEPALKDVSLELPFGEIVALVGASGAGKSTLADLICRLYDPQVGRVTIDDTDLRDYDLDSWRAAIGIVSQESLTLDATIFDNIRYGKLGASKTEVVEAAVRANADEFIQDLPRGYDTMVGERGVLLSGGQRQRLAIARAVIRDPQILILDEATSALDNVSERLIRETINSLRADRAVLMIAHRLSTIQQANRIVVMDFGKITETGTHSDLIHKGGIYTELYQESDPNDKNPPSAKFIQETED